MADAVITSKAIGATDMAVQTIQSSAELASDVAAKTFNALAPAAGEVVNAASSPSVSHALVMKDLSINMLYLLATSFMIGVLFTIFILLVLDFMRLNNNNDSNE